MSAIPVHKDSLVRTAMRLFRRQGYSSTGLNQILSESGAPKGSLYHYFPGGKEELAVAAVGLAASMIRLMLEDLSRTRRTSRTFVKGYCDTMANWMEESGYRSGCPIATTMLETAPDSPALVKAGQAALESWVCVISDVFIRDGIGSSDAQKKALALIGAVQGALILARVWNSSDPLHDVARQFA
ncbi:MAG: TetR/AcrR family transcriptional regulator [Pseudomonadales bacterium]